MCTVQWHLSAFTSFLSHHHSPSPERFSSCKTKGPYWLNNNSLFPDWPQPLILIQFSIWFHYACTGTLGPYFPCGTTEITHIDVRYNSRLDIS